MNTKVRAIELKPYLTKNTTMKLNHTWKTEVYNLGVSRHFANKNSTKKITEIYVLQQKTNYKT